MVVNQKTTGKIGKIIAVMLLAAILRFWHLSALPPAPYWEEAAIGYDAYSILKTGKDFHGNSFPLVAFESFGDYKPSLYFYATTPAVAVFGLNPFAVRFASALFGTLTVLLVYSIWGLPAALMLAILPWHVILSRVGFEANLGLFFLVAGAWAWLKKWPLPAVVLLVASMYTYHANRVLVPLLGLAWGLFSWRFLLKQWKLALAAVVLAVIFAWPLLSKLNTPQIKQRFYETSAFSALEPVIVSNQLIAEDGGGLLARVLHHRYWQYLGLAAGNYADHFTASFLFLSGDDNPRHSIQTTGQLYLIFLPLIFFGALTLWRKNKPLFYWLSAWLLLSPVPAALTRATPHALRSLPMVIPLAVFAAAGLINLFKRRRLFGILAVLVLVFEFGRFWYAYENHYPINHSTSWQYGYEELMTFVNKNYDNYQKIYITRELGRPSMYYWFYSKTDPRLVQAVNNVVSKDQGEYLAFEKIEFISPPINPEAGSLVVSSLPLNNYGDLVLTVNDLSNKPVFYAYEIQ